MQRNEDGKVVSRVQTAAVVLSLLLLLGLTFTLQFFATHVKQTKRRNKFVRAALFKRLELTPFLVEKEGQEKENGETKTRRKIIGFFHPYCNAGGGGERVLWQAIEHQLRQNAHALVVVYSGDVGLNNKLDSDDGSTRHNGETRKRSTNRDRTSSSEATKEEILSKCNTRFGIPLHSKDLASRIHFIPLTTRYMVSDDYWNRLTLLGQAYGSARMAFEACSQLLPDVFIDTMGYAFAYPVVRMFNNHIPIGAYVHYPMISTDMLRRVKERQAGHTNAAAVSKSHWRTMAKLTYYRLFARMYAHALRSADVLVANGTWTCNHLNTLTLGPNANEQKNSTSRVKVVYPPCDTASLTAFGLSDRDRLKIVSLAQFRPEKEHATQIRIMKEMVERLKEAGKNANGLKLICMGSSRNEGDERRIEGLKKLAAELQIEKHVEFVVNAPYSTLLENLRTASIGLSTMVDEHFGINVVEFMAAGLITLSHASAGPLLDIAVATTDGKPTGFHAKSVDEFADGLERIIDLAKDEDLAVRMRARQRAVDTFSNEAFCQSWDINLWQRLDPSMESKKTV